MGRVQFAKVRRLRHNTGVEVHSGVAKCYPTRTRFAGWAARMGSSEVLIYRGRG